MQPPRTFRPLPVRVATETKPNEPPHDPWNVLDIADLTGTLPPISWVCESLRLAPGACTMVAGYGYSRKTMALQSLGLSVAAGKSIWGVWSCRKGPFLHIDYEQGRRLTQERYQRLARGMGFELGDLAKGQLRAAVLPRVYLDSEESFDGLARLSEGCTLVLVDSLRAAFPSVDENSSEVRNYLDMLMRVSEKTGAAFVVIHHARKPSQASPNVDRYSIRGAGALYDACQSTFLFSGEKNEPTKVAHEKERVIGQTLEDFGLSSEDVPSPSNPRHGLLVRHLEVEQMIEAASHRQQRRSGMTDDKTKTEIVDLFRQHGYSLSLSRRDIRSLSKISTKYFDTAWTALMAEGRLSRLNEAKGAFRWVMRTGYNSTNGTTAAPITNSTPEGLESRERPDPS